MQIKGDIFCVTVAGVTSEAVVAARQARAAGVQDDLTQAYVFPFPATHPSSPYSLAYPAYTYNSKNFKWCCFRPSELDT